MLIHVLFIVQRVTINKHQHLHVNPVISHVYPVIHQALIVKLVVILLESNICSYPTFAMKLVLMDTMDINFGMNVDLVLQRVQNVLEGLLHNVQNVLVETTWI